MGTPGEPCRRWCRRSRENFVSTTMLARLEWLAYRLSDQTGMAQSVVNCLLRLAKWPKWRSTWARAPLRHLQSNHLQKKNTTTSFLKLFPFGAIGIPQWVSSYQFLVHFQQYTGTVGPTRTVHMGTAARPHCWIQILSEGNLGIAPVRRRPAGAAIAIWIRCYWMRISPVIVSGIDGLFLSHVGRPITKVGRQLEGIPLPTRQGWCS